MLLLGHLFLFALIGELLVTSIYNARGKLKTYNNDCDEVDRVFINEDLVDSSKKLLNAARAQVRAKCLAGAWTKNCRVTVKTVAGSTISLTNHAQLNALVREAQRGAQSDDE
jgi:Na+-transporting NADH:ubiquinone oxidoreductase subunit NqrF